MDYIIVAFLSVVTPFSLSLSNIDYQTGFSMKSSNSTKQGTLSNSTSTEAVNPAEGQKITVIDTRHYGPYGIFYDVSVEYKFYPYINNDGFLKKVWFSPKVGYEPLRDSFLITYRSNLSAYPGTIPLYANQHPYFGINIGYDLSQRPTGETFSPYFGIQIMRFAYEGDTFDIDSQYDSAYTLTLGLAYKMNSNWALNVEIARTQLEAYAASSLPQDMLVTITRIKLGTTYYLDNRITTTHQNKDPHYIEVMKSLDPNVSKKMKSDYERKKAEEALLKQQRKQAQQESLEDSEEEE